MNDTITKEWMTDLINKCESDGIVSSDVAKEYREKVVEAENDRCLGAKKVY